MPKTARTGDAIVEAFLRHVADRPSDVIAIASNARSTFGDVHELARGLAASVQRRLPSPGGLVGLAAANGPAFLAGFLALRMTGHPVLLLDAQAPPGDRGRAATAMGAIGTIECGNAWPPTIDDFGVSYLEPVRPPGGLEGIAVVKLTSGSTGTPRGVAMRAETLLADESALAETMGFRADDRLLAALPFSHSYGFTTLALSALVRGLRLVMPVHAGPFGPLMAAAACGATIFPTVPAYVKALLAMSEPPAWPDTVRLVISAGATLPPSVATQFRQTYGRPIHTFYGSSECGGICYDRQGDAAERGSVGTPVHGVTVSISPTPGASDGEGLVVVESAAVGETYLPAADDRLKAKRFQATDRGAWVGGELVLRGRADRAINVHGRKVDPGEVEEIIRGIGGVDDVVVIGVGSPITRQELVCAIVAGPPQQLSYEAISAWCRERLADYKVPRSILIVDQIPYTSRGKLDLSSVDRLRGAATQGNP